MNKDNKPPVISPLEQAKFHACCAAVHSWRACVAVYQHRNAKIFAGISILLLAFIAIF